MGDHPTAAFYKETFDPQNPDRFREGLADDVIWHMIGGETLQGADAVMESMSGLSGLDFSLELHDVVANDEHAVALMHVTVKVGDDEFEYRTAEIYHVSDGKITERWAFSDDTQRIIDFFGQLGEG